MTINRGVEAKELEIANINLDRNSNSCSASVAAEGSGRPPAPAPPALDSSGSFVQVVVQQRAGARLPRASSPARPLYLLNQSAAEGGACGDGGGVVLLPASLLLPALTATSAQAPPDRQDEECGRPSDAGAGDSRLPEKLEKSSSTWRILNSINAEKFNLTDNGPERVEVYYFEQGAGAWLATSDAGAVTACERWARAAAKASAIALAPLPAIAHLLLAAPLALIITLERCVLTAVRDVVTGVVQTASDYALKPGLALAYNAALRPPAVFAHNAARALRLALQPLAAAANDAIEPVARLLRAVQLVTVHCNHGNARRQPDHEV